MHLHRGSFILDRRREKVEACPNQNSILVARSLVFLRPISASFPAEEVDNREETAARVHTSRRGVLCNRGCQGGEHTHPFLPYYGSHAGVRRVQRVTRFPKDSVTADFAISKDSFCKCDFSPLDRFESHDSNLFWVDVSVRIRFWVGIVVYRDEGSIIYS